MEDQKNEDKMSPEEFAKQMKNLSERYGDDEEMFHLMADGLLTAVLVDLGYEEGVKIFLDQPKWYA